MSSIDALVTTVASKDTIAEAAQATVEGFVAQVGKLRTTGTDSATAGRIVQLEARMTAASPALIAALVASALAPAPVPPVAAPVAPLVPLVPLSDEHDIAPLSPQAKSTVSAKT